MAMAAARPTAMAVTSIEHLWPPQLPRSLYISSPGQ
jgi:hypothetical protein